MVSRMALWIFESDHQDSGVDREDRCIPSSSDKNVLTRNTRPKMLAAIALLGFRIKSIISKDGKGSLLQ